MPRLLLNKEIAEKNISKVINKAKSNNLEYRPHFKTHQSHIVGEWFRKKGINGITVSSLEMADYFAKAGWDDITVAFPADSMQNKLIDRLAKSCSLSMLIVSETALKLLQDKLTGVVGLYIEVDPGYGRSGVSSNDIERIRTLIDSIEGHKLTTFRGFYSHAGHTYKARGKSEIVSIANASLDRLSNLSSHFPGIHICFGDTPSCSVLDNFGSVTQLSAGNLVFYDWIQTKIGSCSVADIAVMMECVVVEKYEDRKQLLIHGGAVHFSKDYLEEGSKTIFGVVASDWGQPQEENYICSLSQEHGIVQCTSSYFDSVSIGDVINIYPIHSCLTANLMGEYYIYGQESTVDHFSRAYHKV